MSSGFLRGLLGACEALSGQPRALRAFLRLRWGPREAFWGLPEFLSGPSRALLKLFRGALKPSWGPLEALLMTSRGLLKLPGPSGGSLGASRGRPGGARCPPGATLSSQGPLEALVGPS
eukprot:3972590-Pyramimonas_sp.AAC.1